MPMPMPMPTPQPPPTSIRPPKAGSAATPIGGRYVVSAARSLPGAGGGLPAYEASDAEGGTLPLMAVQVRQGAPPRAPALDALVGMNEPGVLSPLALCAAPAADGRPAWFVIATAPPGPAVWPDLSVPVRPWSETALVLRLLRPAAAALAALAQRKVTHRAIRPSNLFRAGETEDVALGCAWASPPALLQPTVFEPPYVAICPPAARGAGTMADDIYALGVCLLALSLGHLPMAGLSDDEVIARKLELGCFQALTAGARLTPLLSDLLTGMLANDPQHRPPPNLLADPGAARARRIATRPQRRAAQSLQIEGIQVWNARMLAFAIARHPATAARLLRIGVVDHWLRRALGEPVPAGHIEEAVRHRSSDFAPGETQADAWLCLRVVTMLDPLAPLCWHGLSLWPDGLGPALAAAMADGEAGEIDRLKLGELINREAIGTWATARPEHCDPTTLRMDAREHRAMARERGWAGGLSRLCYALNPLLPCRSPLLGGAAVATPEAVLPALEAAAARDGQRATLPLDRDLAGFLAARLKGRGDGEFASLSDSVAPGDAVLSHGRVLVLLQAQPAAPPVPRLAGWLLDIAAPLLERCHGRSRRIAKLAQLTELAQAGDLRRLLQALDNPGELRADADDFQAAQTDARRIDDELANVAAGGAQRAEMGRRLGQEIAAAVALAALAVAAVAAGLS
jgi:eukaryotic-like serine/threonine-protein kinase